VALANTTKASRDYDSKCTSEGAESASECVGDDRLIVDYRVCECPWYYIVLNLTGERGKAQSDYSAKILSNQIGKSAIVSSLSRIKTTQDFRFWLGWEKAAKEKQGYTSSRSLLYSQSSARGEGAVTLERSPTLTTREKAKLLDYSVR